MIFANVGKEPADDTWVPTMAVFVINIHSLATKTDTGVLYYMATVVTDAPNKHVGYIIVKKTV